MSKKILLRVGIGFAVLAGSTVAYASIFGEENVTLVRQLSELIGISRNTREALAEAREGIDIAREAADDVRRTNKLIEELDGYTTDRFIADFKRDVLQTYPDLDYIIKSTNAAGLDKWRNSEMSSPMGSYELIGRVFGEVTAEIKEAQDEGLVELEGPILYRYEAATSLTASEDANDFVALADEDIEVLVERLNGATKEEAIVIQAKIQAIAVAQQSHILRLLSRMVRREGIEDARHYQEAVKSMEMGLELVEGQKELDRMLVAPKMLNFDNSWMELE